MREKPTGLFSERLDPLKEKDGGGGKNQHNALNTSFSRVSTAQGESL